MHFDADAQQILNHIPPSLQPHLAVDPIVPALARLRIHAVSSLDWRDGRAAPLRWAWQGDATEVCSLHSMATVKCSSPQNYEATVEYEPGAQGAQSALLSLCCAVLEHAGGRVLHGAAVLLEQGVLAFIGPSGVGKSTACIQMADAPLFSNDRIAIYEQHNQLFAWSLPLGNPPAGDFRTADQCAALLRGVLRIQHAAQSQIRPVGLPQAVLWLRESFRSAAVFDVQHELQHLERAQRFAQLTMVAGLDFALQTPLAPLVQNELNLI